jgi:hypothetical protein
LRPISAEAWVQKGRRGQGESKNPPPGVEHPRGHLAGDDNARRASLFEGCNRVHATRSQEGAGSAIGPGPQGRSGNSTHPTHSQLARNHESAVRGVGRFMAGFWRTKTGVDVNTIIHRWPDLDASGDHTRGPAESPAARAPGEKRHRPRTVHGSRGGREPFAKPPRRPARRHGLLLFTWACMGLLACTKAPANDAFPPCTLLIQGTDIRYKGQVLPRPGSVAQWEAVLGPASRRDERFDTVHVWDSLGLNALGQGKEGTLTSFSVLMNPPRPRDPILGPLEYLPHSTFTGRLCIDGSEITRLHARGGVSGGGRLEQRALRAPCLKAPAARRPSATWVGWAGSPRPTPAARGRAGSARRSQARPAPTRSPP